MKKIVILCFFAISSVTMFANDVLTSNLKQKTMNPVERHGEEVVRKPCTVQVTQSGTAVGLDCNGIFYVQPIVSSCTKSSQVDCVSAYTAANSCASTTLANDIAAFNAQQQNCN